MQAKKSLFAKLTSGFLAKWWFVVIAALALFVIGAIVFVFFPTWLRLIIDSEITLRDGGMTYEWWRKPPVEPIMKVYIYNVTNADEFLRNGEKPKVQEVGPYVYRQTWEKKNVTFNENGTVTFNQSKMFVFDPELSVGSVNALVIVPNVPMLSATSQSKNAARFLRLAMASIMDLLKIKPFVEVPVGQLLWGYDDPLIKLAKDVTKNASTLPYDKFGLLYGRNGTSQDLVTIFTGATDITKYGLMDKYSGASHLKHWKTEECNRIDGSDGSIFPPHMNQNTTLYVYEKDLCRRLPLRFKEEVATAGGVMGFRFVPPEDVFADAETNPENDCFCPDGPPCVPSGFFNVSRCQYDSPVLLSFPHFLGVDPKYREAVDGISPPNEEEHGFYLDVHPEMGVALGAKARVQINLAVSQVTDIKQVATFPDIIFPIMWFEDGIDGLPHEVTDLLKLGSDLPPVLRAGISYGLFALGAILLILAVICLVRNSSRQETLRLEGTSHYVKPTTEKPPTNSNMSSGKTLDTLNPNFMNGSNTNGTNHDVTSAH